MVVVAVVVMAVVVAAAHTHAPQVVCVALHNSAALLAHVIQSSDRTMCLCNWERLAEGDRERCLTFLDPVLQVRCWWWLLAALLDPSQSSCAGCAAAQRVHSVPAQRCPCGGPAQPSHSAGAFRQPYRVRSRLC